MISYAITDPSFYNSINAYEWLQKIEPIVDFVLYRDKNSKNYAKSAKEFIEISKNLNFKKIIHQDWKLAKELDADGVHLNSLQFSEIKDAKKAKLLTIISTHTIEEIKKAKELSADIVTFSPIFNTPNKGKAKGILELKKAIECCDIKVIALGGIIAQKEIELVRQSKAYGFASIRYFV